MFSKKERLSRAEFSREFPKTKRFHNDFMTLHFLSSAKVQVSVVTGKKVSKLAVIRNRTRRRVYAALRRNFNKNPKNGIFIVVCKPTIVSLPAALFESEIQKLLALTA